MKKIKYLLISFIFILSGCINETEPNNVAFITAIGIDKGTEDSTYRFTIQFAKPTEISGGSSEGGGKGSDIIENVSVDAPNIYSAMALANSVVSKTLSLSHIKLFVFSKEVAESGVSTIIETMQRSEHIRPNTYVSISNTEARKYLSDINPAVEINPTKYYELIYEKNEFVSIPKTFSQDFYFNYKENSLECSAPICGVAEIEEDKSNSTSKGGEEESRSQESEGSNTKEKDNTQNKAQLTAPVNENKFAYKLRDYSAGEVGIFNETKSEVIGTAIFKGDKMVGELKIIDTMLFNIINNTFKKNYISFKSVNSNTPIDIKLYRTKNTKINYDKESNKATIKIFLQGDFMTLPPDYIGEKHLDELEKEISNSINQSAIALLEKTSKDYNSDIFGIGGYAKRQFLTYNDFMDYNWEEKYKTIVFEVNVDLKIRRTGLIIRTGTTK